MHGIVACTPNLDANVRNKLHECQAYGPYLIMKLDRTVTRTLVANDSLIKKYDVESKSQRDAINITMRKMLKVFLLEIMHLRLPGSRE